MTFWHLLPQNSGNMYRVQKEGKDEIRQSMNRTDEKKRESRAENTFARLPTESMIRTVRKLEREMKLSK